MTYNSSDTSMATKHTRLVDQGFGWNCCQAPRTNPSGISICEADAVRGIGISTRAWYPVKPCQSEASCAAVAALIGSPVSPSGSLRLQSSRSPAIVQSLRGCICAPAPPRGSVSFKGLWAFTCFEIYEGPYVGNLFHPCESSLRGWCLKPSVCKLMRGTYAGRAPVWSKTCSAPKRCFHEILGWIGDTFNHNSLQ